MTTTNDNNDNVSTSTKTQAEPYTVEFNGKPHWSREGSGRLARDLGFDMVPCLPLSPRISPALKREPDVRLQFVSRARYDIYTRTLRVRVGIHSLDLCADLPPAYRHLQGKMEQDVLNLLIVTDISCKLERWLDKPEVKATLAQLQAQREAAEKVQQAWDKGRAAVVAAGLPIGQAGCYYEHDNINNVEEVTVRITLRGTAEEIGNKWHQIKQVAQLAD